MYQRVLIASDLSEGAATAAIAARFVASPTADHRFVHVTPAPRQPEGMSRKDKDAFERFVVERDDALRLELRAWAGKVGFPNATSVVRHGSVAAEVADEARGEAVDLVVVGSRGLSRFERLLLGSSARGIVRRARSSDVLVARGPVEAGAFKRILVATDFYAPAQAAAARARELASARAGAELLVLHTIDPDMWEAALRDPAPIGNGSGAAWLHHNMRDMLHEFNEKHLGARAEEVLVHGHPGTETAEYARAHRVDLVVVGTHGPGRLERALIGSAAEAIVERAPCSVLVVRS